MNTLVYADIPQDMTSNASSIASTVQQLSISFGVACASLVTGWFLGGNVPAAGAGLIAALHEAFLTLGALTIVSSLTFLSLRANDGNNLSNRTGLRPAEQAGS